MKHIFTILFFLFTIIAVNAQVCTQSNFDACTGSSAITSDFRNAVQITGTGNPLTVGAKYKFNYAIPALNLDAVISIEGKDFDEGIMHFIITRFLVGNFNRPFFYLLLAF